MMGEARERFEEWATESGWVLSRNKDGSYCNRTTDAAWGGFMAAIDVQPVQSPPLTNEQILHIWNNSNPTAFEALSFARAIEAALKGKP